ncbi:MAG: hypothetical protein JW811_02960 [Clostridiales bacterium]|nr:hypothetical protein [Clostridiales bacterium]
MGPMKKHCLQTVCLIISLLMLRPCAASAGQAAATPQEMLQAYQSVLLGDQSYLRYNTFDDLIEEAVMTDEITDWYDYVPGPPFSFVAFAVTDLDMNGNPELLLQLSEDFGYELLRYDNGRVYGYPFVARAMEAVTADGEIHGSSGADNFGWYRICFHGAALRTIVICWKYDEEAPAFRYMIGDTEGTEEDFTALNDTLWNKESVSFTPYSPEAVAEAAAAF